MTAFVINLLLTGLWILVTADASPLNAAMGFVIGYALLAWLWPRAMGRSYIRKLPAAIVFTFYITWAVIRSSVAVASAVLFARPKIEPAFLHLSLEDLSDAEITLLANLITLTPGTVAVDLTEDRSEMILHVMFAHDPEAVRKDIKQNFERPIRNLLR